MPREDLPPVIREKSIDYKIGSAAEYSQVRNLAHGVKAGDATSIAFAAKLMASTVRELAGSEGNGVLVPIPGHGGLAKYTLDLAETIGNLTGLPVVNALISDRHEALYTVKKSHKNTDEVPLSMEQVKNIPVGMFPILIDNVLDTGKTASNAYKALNMDTTKMAVLGDTIKFTHNSYTPYWRFHFKNGEVSMLLRDAYLKPGDRFKIEDNRYTVLNVYPPRTAKEGDIIVAVNGKGGIDYLDSQELSNTIITMPIPKFKEEVKKEQKGEVGKEYSYTVLGELFSEETHPQHGFLRKEISEDKSLRLIYDRPLTDAEIKIFQLRPDTEMQELIGKQLYYKTSKGFHSIRIDSLTEDHNGFNLITFDLDGKVSVKTTISYADMLKKVHGGKWKEKEYFDKKNKSRKKSRTNHKLKFTTMPNSRKQTVKQKDAAQSQSRTENVKMTATENGKSVVNPVAIQYQNFKEKHPNVMMLVRVGDFYETYFKDAEKASEIFRITLTRRNDNGMPIAGFPYHCLDTYLPKLIRAGQRVAICDPIEMEEAKSLLKDNAVEVKNGEATAKVIELVTPGKEQEAVKSVQESSITPDKKESVSSKVQKTTKEEREAFIDSIVAITGKRNHEAFESNLFKEGEDATSIGKGFKVEDKYGHEHQLVGIKVLRGRVTFEQKSSEKGVRNLQVVDLSSKSLKSLSVSLPPLVSQKFKELEGIKNEKKQDDKVKVEKTTSKKVEKSQNETKDKIQEEVGKKASQTKTTATASKDDKKEVKDKPVKKSSTKAQRDAFTQAIVAATGRHVHKPLDVDFGENNFIVNTIKGEKIKLKSMQVLRGRVTFTDENDKKVQLVNLSAFTLAKLQGTMVDLGGAMQKKLDAPKEKAKAKAEELNRVVVASDDQQQKFVEQIRALMGKEKSITLPEFGTQKGVVASAGNEGVSFLRLYNWNDNISFAGTVPGDDNKEVRYYHPKDIRPEFYNYLVGEVRKAMKPALVTENGEKVTNLAVFEDTRNPGTNLIYGKVGGKGVHPKTISSADYDSYLSGTMSAKDLFVKYFPTKMAKKLSEEQFNSLKLSNGKELTLFRVYQQRNEQKPHYKEWLMYAECNGKRYHATPMNQAQKDAYFDGVVSKAKLAEEVLGEQLRLKSAYEKYHLPDPEQISEISLRKGTSGKWVISAMVAGKGRTDEHTVSGNDLAALFHDKTATKAQLAAKYLNNDIEDLSMSKKVQRTQSMKR